VRRRAAGLAGAWRSVALALLAPALALGCEKTKHEAPAQLEPCREVGQRCEFAPGKLGACVLRDGCRGDACFVCQSQH
jgi:hypothetical protein